MIIAIRYCAPFLLAIHLCSGFVTAESLLNKPVRRFIYHGKTHNGSMGHLVTQEPGYIEGAFFSLALHAEVPIGIQPVPAQAVGSAIPIQIDVQGTTVGDILEQMVRQDRRYVYRERLGIIEALPVHAGTNPGDCLNMVIPKFSTNEEWNYAFQSLKCQIDRVSKNKELLPDPI